MSESTFPFPYRVTEQRRFLKTPEFLAQNRLQVWLYFQPVSERYFGETTYETDRVEIVL